MKKLLFLVAITVTAASLAGCNSCRQGGGLGSWFNRGDRCDDAPPADCIPGMPRATMMVPSVSPQVLPGPIEIAPTN